MGIFDFNGEDVSQVFANTQPINDEAPKDRYTENLLQAIRKELPIENAVLLNLLTGTRSTLINGFYQYGQTTFGLPFTDLNNDFYNEVAVKTVLEGLEGEPLTLTASFLYTPTLYNWSKWWLQENEPSYDYTSNTLVIGPTTWDVVGFTQDEDTNEITVLLENGAATNTYGPITEYWEDELYYIVEYYKDSDPATRYIWLYRPSLNTYPSLDVSLVSALDNAVSDDFFPIVPIRMRERNINDYTDTELVSKVKTILKKLYINLDEFTDGVTKQPNSDGDLVDIPDLPKISDIFVMYGINVYDTSAEGKKYLFNFFDRLSLISRIDRATYEASSSDLSNVFFIRQNTFFYYLKYNYIEITEVSKTVGEIGTYDTSFDIQFPSSEGSTETGFFTSYKSSFFVFHQISKGVCRCIQVHGLRVEHFINERGLRETVIELEAFTLNKELTDNQRNFVIPLAKSHIDALTNREADALLPVSLHLLVYAGDTIHLDWGESNATFLKIVFRVVGAVLFILGLGPQGLTAAEAAIATLTYIVSVAAIEYTLRKVLLSTDNDLVRTVAAVAAVVAIVYIGPDFSTLSTADQLISSVNAVSRVTNTYTLAEFTLLEKEIVSFSIVAEAKEKELQDAYDFLNTDASINLYTLLDTSTYRYEEPDDFFTRTLNTAPGQLTFEQLHNYVDNSLNLEYISY